MNLEIKTLILCIFIIDCIECDDQGAKTGGGLHRDVYIGIGLGTGMFILMILYCIALILCKRKKKKQKEKPKSPGSMDNPLYFNNKTHQISNKPIVL